MNILGRIENYFTRKTETLNLSLFTIFFCGGLVLMILYNWSGQSQYLYLRSPQYEPPEAFGLFPIPTLTREMTNALGITFLAALTMSFCGVKTRIFLLLGFLCYFFYFGQMMNYTFVRRKTNLISFVLLILAVAPGINKCGLLPLWRTRKSDKTSNQPEMTERWPLDLIKIFLSVLYFLFGYTKLFHAGIAWADGQTLQAQLLTFYLYGDMPYALQLAQYPFMCMALSWFTIVFELTFWLILIWPRLTYPFVFAGLFFHSGIAAVMEIYYIKYFGLTYVLFADADFLRTCRAFFSRWRSKRTSNETS